ncbi:hypothetical protein KP509_11G048900 [Ceratopteris richardii]|nr:hypothetical protein KP509_11G048900 [Ceratopteris richardii]
MLAGYVHSGHGHLAIELFADMEHMPDQVTLTSVIKACGMVSSLKQGQCAHQIAVESGLAASQYVTSSLINMYVQCGALDEAQQLFTNLPQRSVVLWNALISGYVCHGNNQSAVDCFIKMQEEKIIPNNRTISIVLKACGNLCLQEQGSILYALMLEKSIVEDEILLVALVDMYVNCGDLEAAHSILNVTRSVPKAAWGAMLAGCAQQENGLLALEVYGEMQHKSIDADAAIYACIIKAAGLVGALEEGKLIHDQLIRHDLETNIVIGSALTDMYNKCGALDNGLNVYKALQKQDLVSWSTMISGYVQHGSHSSALKLFEQLKAEGVEPDKVMYSSILNACGGLRAVEQGKWLHHDINISEFHHDESLWTAFINMYCQCGYLEDAISLFERITVKTLLAWSAIILGHIQNGSVQAALCFFSRMQSSGINVDETILMSLLKTCGNSEQLNFMHERIKQMGFDSHLGIGNCLIDMYGKIGDLTMARKVFDCSPCKDVVTWNSMIAAYAEHSSISPLLELYGEMQLVGLESDAFTFSCMLKACRKVREIDLGNLIFDQVIRKSFETDAVIIRSLIEMYAELGSLDDAMKVFDIPVNGLSSWSTMIGAFAENNNFELALKFFEDRQKHGWKPDDKVLTSFLASISHSGQWERGQRYLNLLNEGSGFDPKLEHMNCAVDLLGRSGHICEAGELLQALPQPPDMIGLTSLLSSCKSHGSDLQEMLVQKVGY